jgi:hypothetical protein
MSDETQHKILQLLDVISVEVAANRQEISANCHETAELRAEMRTGFGRVERRLGNIEVRVETIERRVEAIEGQVEAVGTELRSFRGEFERRISPLER